MAKIANPRDIIIAPVLSEKSYGLMEQNTYTFFVAPSANKTQIKIAVEQIFGVDVASVNTVNREGKRKRTRTGFGKRKDTKRAYVTLREGSDSIDIFGASALEDSIEKDTIWLFVSTSRQPRVAAPAPFPSSRRSLARLRKSRCCARSRRRVVVTPTATSPLVTAAAATSVATA